MTNQVAEWRRTTSVQEVSYLYHVLDSLSENLEHASNDIILTDNEKVVPVYVLDFQEIYSFLYPHKREDSDPKVMGDDIIAEYVLSHLREPFVLLDGTYLELADKLAQIGAAVAPLEDLGQFGVATERLHEYIEALLRVGEELEDDQRIRLGARPISEKALQLLSHRESSLNKLIGLLKRPNHVDLSQFFSPNAFPSIAKSRVKTVLEQLSLHSTEQRSARNINNLADALNIAAVLELNEFFGEAFRSGRTERRYLFYLLTHTHALLRLPTVLSGDDDVSLNVEYSIGGRHPNIMRTPMSLFVWQMLSRVYPEASGRLFYLSVEGLRNQTEHAKTSIDSIRYRMKERGECLEDVLLTLVESEQQSLDEDEMRREFRIFSDLFSKRFFSEADAELLRASFAYESLPLAAREQEETTVALWRSASNVSALLCEIEGILFSRNPLLSQRWSTGFAGPKPDAGVRARSMFAAENLGFERELEDSWDETQQCRTFRLIEKRSKKLALEIRLFGNFYSVVWPTNCPPQRFLSVVKELLVGYVPKREKIKLVDTIAVWDAEGELSRLDITGGGLPKGLELADVRPRLICVTTMRGIFFCEVFNSTSSCPISGVVSSYRSIEQMIAFYSRTSGRVFHETLRNELSVIRPRALRITSPTTALVQAWIERLERLLNSEGLLRSYLSITNDRHDMYEKKARDSEDSLPRIRTLVRKIDYDVNELFGADLTGRFRDVLGTAPEQFDNAIRDLENYLDGCSMKKQGRPTSPETRRYLVNEFLYLVSKAVAD